MEYRRAYRDEKPNQGLVERHEREIFPLLKKRYLFAEVIDFLLYDLYDEHGHVNENIFAYSNRCGNEKGLVLYNNAYAAAWGWIRVSAAYKEKNVKNLVQRSLGEGLGLHRGDGLYCIFREQRTNLWFIRSCGEIYEKGLFVNLKGYESQVFLDVYEVSDDARGSYRRLTELLDGAGTQNIEAAMRELIFQPLYAALRSLLYDWYPKLTAALFDALGIEEKAAPAGKGRKKAEASVGFKEADLEGFTAAAREFIAKVNDFSGLGLDLEKAVTLILDRLENSLLFLRRLRQPRVSKAAVKTAAMSSWKFLASFEEIRATAEILFSYSVLQALGGVSFFEEWSLDHEMTKFFLREGCGVEHVEKLCLLLKILLRHEGWYDKVKKYSAATRPGKALEYLFADMDIQRYAGVNAFDGELYFNKEGFLSLLWWLCSISRVRRPPAADSAGENFLRESDEDILLAAWLEAYEKAEYRLHNLFKPAGAKKTKKPSVKPEKPAKSVKPTKPVKSVKPVETKKKPQSSAKSVKEKGKGKK
jgi:hypothetical protein